MKWNRISKHAPKDGDCVIVKTKSGKQYDAIFIDDMGIQGWMINCGFRRNVGNPVFWRVAKQPLN